MTTPIVLVQGTDAWNADLSRPNWWQAQSPFNLFLLQHGCAQFRGDDPFLWTTNLDGAAPWLRFMGHAVGFLTPQLADHRDWISGGRALRDHLAPPRCPTPLAQRNLIAHSHGLQVALYAASQGLQVQNLISVCSPVRADMRAVASVARPNIARWLHLYDPTGADTMQEAGEFGDGHLGISQRTHPLADRNDGVPGIKHSNVLYDASYFHYWHERGWLDFLKVTQPLIRQP